jgi:uncharacterized membrane protein YgdD (TMEM256/DUF423 family)
MRRMKNWRLFFAGLGGAAAVAAGAIGSHALALEPGTRAAQAYEHAVSYLLVHSVALLALGLLTAPATRNAAARLAAMLFVGGMFLFSGSLIVSTILGAPGMRVVAPWGGSALIAGWVALAIGALTLGEDSNSGGRKRHED